MSPLVLDTALGGQFVRLAPDEVRAVLLDEGTYLELGSWESRKGGLALEPLGPAT
jgi:hypothetical protein